MPIKNTLLLQALAIASLVVLGFFLWDGDKGFDLWDEGYLWYGVQRVMLGEVPMRDFMAYDPGRYYWSAGLMSLWGDNGIIALRASVALFEALGVSVALLWIARAARRPDPLYLLLSAVTLALWMFPRHKYVDISLSIFLVGALAFLIQNPTGRRYFLAGLCVGLVAVFGRNHGVYGVVGSIGAILWLSLARVDGPHFVKALAYWAAGVATGYAPMLLMALLVPGFAHAILESIDFLFEIKSTGIPLPVPWPWRVDFSAPPDQAIRGVVIGLLFIGIIVFGVLSVLWAFWQRFRGGQASPALVAASFMALPYVHRAFSRAAIGTLAQAIFPLLIGCLIFAVGQRGRVKWPLVIAMCAASLWLMHVYHEGWQCRAGQQCVGVEVSDDELVVMPNIAGDVALLRQLADKYAPDGQSFVAAPFWPGAYALLERKSPMWEIYALFPRSPAFERAEIERLKAAKPGFAFVYDLPLDGREDLRFRNTHPLIFGYIVDHFEQMDSPAPDYLIFKAKPAGP